jgi:hypothetical protein
MARRLSRDELHLLEALKLKRQETVSLFERIDVSDDEDAAHMRRQAVNALGEGFMLAMRALTRPQR